jgi:hypothetical protein
MAVTEDPLPRAAHDHGVMVARGLNPHPQMDVGVSIDPGRLSRVWKTCHFGDRWGLLARPSALYGALAALIRVPDVVEQIAKIENISRHHGRH